MARTTITPTALTANAATAVAATTIDATLVSNGISVASVAAGGSLIIRVTNTHGSDHDVTIKAGDNPPAFQAPLGDLAVTVVATSGVKFIGPFETARFLQDDGTINIDLASGHTGVIEIYSMPKGY